jgi:hypothetical protein
MALLPRSLLARSILLIALILIASQVAWIQFYRMSSARSQSEQVASHIVGVLNTVSAALDAMPATARTRSPRSRMSGYSPRRASTSTSSPSRNPRCSPRLPRS